MFGIIQSFFSGPSKALAQGGCFDRRCDPLSHPAVRRMTPDELADLPLGRLADNHNGRCGEDGRLRA